MGLLVYYDMSFCVWMYSMIQALPNLVCSFCYRPNHYDVVGVNLLLDLEIMSYYVYSWFESVCTLTICCSIRDATSLVWNFLNFDIIFGGRS